MEKRENYKAIVSVYINIESGCNPLEGEYTVHIDNFIGVLNLTSPGGTDDISKILECIENNIEKLPLPKEGDVNLRLIESGEWEDVFWNKYYEIESFIIYE